MRQGVPSRAPRPRARPLAGAVARALAGLAGLALAGAGAALVPATAFAAPAAPPHVIQDPYYGQVLFDFYRDEYFTALTELMVAQSLGRVSHHDDEAEVLRGGLLLSYGMHKQAGEIFDQLIARHAPPSVQDRAWFFLAKIRYQRGLDAEAEAAIDKVGTNLPPALDEQRQLLKAQLLMARGEYAGAAKVLDTLVKASVGGWFFNRTAGNLFARYNLGVAQVRGGDTAKGVAVLDAIGTMPGPDEETRALRDRANVALGFAALQADKPLDARKYLERVRLQGPSANKALLGFGWAAASLKQYNNALVPWNELVARDPDDAAVLEARIAAPYAYGELGAAGQALRGYQDAITAFDAENVRLDESIAALRKGSLVETLAQRNAQPGMGWYQNITTLPSALPHPSHLTSVMAQNDFQEGFKNYRDLQFLARNLGDWQGRLGVYDQMLANRRQGFAERLPKVRSEAAGLSSVDLLQKRHDVLAAAVAQGERDADGRAFATEAERALLARIDRVKDTLSKDDATSLVAARERLRLVSGAMTWQLAESEPGRLWDAKKGLKATEAGLAQGRALETELLAAQRDEPARFERLAGRIAALNRRVALLQPRVASLSTEQQQALQGLAITALQQQKERLDGYTSQARFSVAQLYDQAVRKSSDAADTKATKTKAPTGGTATPSPVAPATATPSASPTPPAKPASPAPAPAPAPKASSSPLGLQEDSDAKH
jgi:tetratricopeptide (TPR) repeat protein